MSGIKMSTHRSCPNKFLKKFQRSPFFLPSKSENSNAFFLIPKTGPLLLNWKREETKQPQQIPLEPRESPPPHHHPKSVDRTSVKSSKQKKKKKNRTVVINGRDGQMVPALFITVDKDNESANKTGRKNWERAELFLGNAAPACCQITPAHSHSLTHTHTHTHTHIHTHSSRRRLEREGRRGAERRRREERRIGEGRRQGCCTSQSSRWMAGERSGSHRDVSPHPTLTNSLSFSEVLTLIMTTSTVFTLLL